MVRGTVGRMRIQTAHLCALLSGLTYAAHCGSDQGCSKGACCGTGGGCDTGGAVGYAQ